MLAASANFAERDIGTHDNALGMDTTDIQVATTRGSVVPAGSPAVSTVLLNNQQGYGRVVVSHVLPVVNWPDAKIPGDAALTGDTLEGPALGLLIWDGIDPDGTGPDAAEPPISNSDTLREHHFQVVGTRARSDPAWLGPIPPATSWSTTSIWS